MKTAVGQVLRSAATISVQLQDPLGPGEIKGPGRGVIRRLRGSGLREAAPRLFIEGFTKLAVQFPAHDQTVRIRKGFRQGLGTFHLGQGHPLRVPLPVSGHQFELAHGVGEEPALLVLVSGMVISTQPPSRAG